MFFFFFFETIVIILLSMGLVITLNVIANYSNLQIVDLLITFVTVEDMQLKLQRY